MHDPQAELRRLSDERDDDVRRVRVDRLHRVMTATTGVAVAGAGAWGAGWFLDRESVVAHPVWTGVLLIVVVGSCRIAAMATTRLLVGWDRGRRRLDTVHRAVRDRVLEHLAEAGPHRRHDVAPLLDDLDEARLARRFAVSVVAVLAVVVAACVTAVTVTMVREGLPPGIGTTTRMMLTAALGVGIVAGDVLRALGPGDTLRRTRAALVAARRRHREVALYDGDPVPSRTDVSVLMPAGWPTGFPVVVLIVLVAVLVVPAGPSWPSPLEGTAVAVTSPIALAARESAVPVSWPSGLVVSPDGRSVYVTDSGPPDTPDDRLVVVDLATETVTGTVRVAPGPHTPALAPDGHTLYVTSVGSDAARAGAVSAVDTGTLQLTRTLPLSTVPADLAVSPDGRWLWLTADGPTSRSPGAVTVVDTRTMTVAATVTVGSRPWRIAAAPDGGRVYVGNFGDDTLSVIDAATRRVVGTVAVGHGPAGLAVDQRRHTVWVAAMDEPDHRRAMTAVDTATLTTSPVDLGPPAAGVGGAEAVTLLPDGHRLLVGRHAEGSDPHPLVDVVDPDTRTTTGVLTLPRAYRIAPTPDSQHAVTTSGNLWLLDIP